MSDKRERQSIGAEDVGPLHHVLVEPVDEPTAPPPLLDWRGELILDPITVTAEHALTGEAVEHILGTVPEVPLILPAGPISGRKFGRMADGIVVELIAEVRDITEEWHPDFVKTLVDITAAAPQPAIGWVQHEDGSLAPPPPYVPTPAQQMGEAVAAGVSVVSTVTPALSATYDAAGTAWQQMRDEALYITMFGSFSGGLSELDWPARSGEVVFATPVQFTAVVRAIGDWLTRWSLYAAGKLSEPPPPTIGL